MLKQVAVIVVLSLIIILAMAHAQTGLQLVISAHDWLSDLLKQVFSVGEAGNLIRELIALLAIPVIIGLIPAMVYWLVRRAWFPYFMDVVLIAWLVQTSALVVLYKAVAP